LIVIPFEVLDDDGSNYNATFEEAVRRVTAGLK
jgi:hypothetical protein